MYLRGYRLPGAAWNGVVGATGGVVVLAPHVLHRVGFLAGTALVAGAMAGWLAALVGTLRETATKVLGDFAERGMIRLGRGRVTLLDLERLGLEAGD